MKRTIKKASLLLASLSLFTLTAISQKSRSKVSAEIRIPMQPQYWEYDTAGAEFITNRGVEAVHIKNGAPLFVKGQQFSNGTIEYDVALGEGFPGICFRLSDDRKTGENFYLRYFGATSPESRTTLQYAAMLDSMSLWDLTDEYQAGAKLNIPGWNHVKLVVSGKQMKAYVNDMEHPAMIVPELEAGTTEGGIFFFGGRVTMANLVIRPGVVENLDPAPGYISTYNDPRYLRNWLVSPATDFAYGKEVVPVLPYMGPTTAKDELPDSTTRWSPIKAENRGIVNLTRRYGRVVNNGRRLAWLKTTIYSDRPQERLLHLGFSDEIWMFINGQTLYVDKNQFGSPNQKFPRGRCTIENATVKLPLKQGKNEILIALANYFYGWGIIARLDDTDGIHLTASVQ
ncbi:MAG TPA: hypothetical protein VFS25_05205 [Chitinophaga sp.]|uniref:hypothetical protein n=1 Tax=Chitinophaga sp. TaxID=1869181 RepID=UPI002DBD7F19|nr:hypothetical protein [Chitinophaga sp.]HEU4552206.1 hypothetical protein [Chitinophaga sp.]